MRRDGYSLYVGRLLGQPIRIHASLPLGLLFATGMRFAPGAWLGIALLVLVHELGHGLLVRVRGGRVTGVLLHALGGECAYVGITSPFDRALIAWGGVLGQALMIPMSYLLLGIFPGPFTSFSADFFGVMLGWNVIVIVINLLPVPPLDGARAWSLFPMLRERMRRARRVPRRP